MAVIDTFGIGGTKRWFQKAMPEPTEKNFTTQLGVHVEEFYEMLIELTPNDEKTRVALADTIEAVQHLAAHLKQNGGVTVEPENRQGFLDALVDQLVTATGTAHTQGMGVIGALDAVNVSNFSKFDDDGNPIFDKNMKVMKGPNYKPVDLSPYV